MPKPTKFIKYTTLAIQDFPDGSYKLLNSTFFATSISVVLVQFWNRCPGDPIPILLRVWREGELVFKPTN